MKIFHTRKQFLAFFMPGFLLGVIYVNFIARRYVADPGIFSDYFLNQFLDVQIDVREYLWYLLRLRAVPFLALTALSFTKVRRASVVLFLVWAGTSGGILGPVSVPFPQKAEGLYGRMAELKGSEVFRGQDVVRHG